MYCFEIFFVLVDISAGKRCCMSFMYTIYLWFFLLNLVYSYKFLFAEGLLKLSGLESSVSLMILTGLLAGSAGGMGCFCCCCFKPLCRKIVRNYSVIYSTPDPNPKTTHRTQHNRTKNVTQTGPFMNLGPTLKDLPQTLSQTLLCDL